MPSLLPGSSFKTLLCLVSHDVTIAQRQHSMLALDAGRTVEQGPDSGLDALIDERIHKIMGRAV